jgi:hypothetical protein
MMFPPRVITAIVAVSFFLPVSADFFTNPPTFVYVNGISEQTQDLSTKFTLGQTVQITWSVPKLAYISLTLAHWDVNKGVALSSFLS